MDKSTFCITYLYWRLLLMWGREEDRLLYVRRITLPVRSAMHMPLCTLLWVLSLILSCFLPSLSKGWHAKLSLAPWWLLWKSLSKEAQKQWIIGKCYGWMLGVMFTLWEAKVGGVTNVWGDLCGHSVLGNEWLCRDQVDELGMNHFQFMKTEWMFDNGQIFEKKSLKLTAWKLEHTKTEAWLYT